MTPSLAAFARLTPEALRHSWLEARETSAAIIQDRISLGVSAVGFHFNDATGPPAGASSVATLTQRLPFDPGSTWRSNCAMPARMS